MASLKIGVTKNYSLFKHGAANRPLDVKKHKALKDSMKKYGFIAGYPIICTRDEKKQLVVKDGQHRLTIASALGIPVHWWESDVDFDVAEINDTQMKWNARDYAQKWADNGRDAYSEGLDFADKFGLPIGRAFSLLAGSVTFSNIRSAFIAGKFKVEDRPYAELVASVYSPVSKMSKDVSTSRFLEACMAACRVGTFDADRFVKSASRCRDKLISYSTRDAYLDMMEDIYNFHRRDLFSLKNAALMAMRGRNPTTANGHAGKNGVGKKLVTSKAR